MREGRCRVFTDMELFFLGLESNCFIFLELRKITHDSSVHRTHIAHRVLLLGGAFAPLQIVCARRSLLGVCRHGTFMCRDGKHLLYNFGVGKDYS